MTSTATLTIHVKDENDNVPFINETVIEMCQTDGPSLYTIEPVDLDDDPYSGPFSFRLSGDVNDKWSIYPLQGEFQLLQEPRSMSLLPNQSLR